MIESVVFGIASWFGFGSTDIAGTLELDLKPGSNVIAIERSWDAVVFDADEDSDLKDIVFKDQRLPIGHEGDTVSSILWVNPDARELTVYTDAAFVGRLHLYDFAKPSSLQASSGLFMGDAPKGYNTPHFYTRSDWGADETLREWTPGRGLTNFFRSSAPESRKLPREQKPKITERRNEDGKRLTWPIEQNQSLHKFVVHHTAEHVDESRDPMTLVRAIYYYHTITKGWGDIGYNYLIDKSGNVYEGRAGGATTVGAHTAFYNVGTIGISLMGNFQREKPTKAQLQSLAILMADHADRYNVDVFDSSAWLHAHSHNITSHREVAAQGHGTACPGKHLQDALPQIRTLTQSIYKKMSKSQSRSREALSRHSSAAPNVRGKIDRKIIPETGLAEIRNREVFRRGETKSITIQVRNGTGQTWPKGSYFRTDNIPDGMTVTKFTADKDIAPKIVGTFTATARIQNTINGTYDLNLVPRVPGITAKAKDIQIPVQVSGSVDFLTRDFQNSKGLNLNATSLDRKRVVGTMNNWRNRRQSLQPAPQKLKMETDDAQVYGPDVKIKLSYFEEKFATLSTASSLQISDRNQVKATIKPHTKISITKPDERFLVQWDDQSLQLINPEFKTYDANGVIRIENYDRGLGPSNAYHQFRRQLNFHAAEKGRFIIVNQLPLEKYLWGLAEEPSTEPEAKKHAIHVLARSYVYVYSGSRRKFNTHLYDLEDSPRTSQFYLGYDWERYHALQRELVGQTKGVVLSYEGRPVIGPYFTQSSGESSSKWVSQYPWTIGRKLPYDEGLPAKGHGVGLSGNSARMLARENGYNFEQLLDYFYVGTDIMTAY